ncbi:hypothetical protein [Helicobacter turcicus]|uniref:DUF541 domain-containing protein n=1 Tax=Helicobacter turcicus TaxID=2867412 RepID=A0ABS7JN75_9HELI|nr:hypothetical protein [Helicobacter turcicus]MBX7490859.1 hypothetical protein [Helicobacter turcicus]MBX7545713.1 hypothetical protein [Helicobacter turcicus]
MRFFSFVFLCVIVLIPVSAETLIKQRLSVAVDVTPTQYSSNITITASKELQKLKTLSVENKNAIIKTFNAINDSLGNDSICKGGSFAINPSYYYKDGKKIQEGFETNFALHCEFKESKKQEFNAILENIEAEVSKNPFLMFAFPSVDLNVSDVDFQKSDSVLNVKLLNLALEKANEYGKLTKKKCSIKEITLGDLGNVDVVALRESRLMQSAKNTLEDISLPSAKDAQKNLWGNVVFSCK